MEKVKERVKERLSVFGCDFCGVVCNFDPWARLSTVRVFFNLVPEN